MYMGFSSCSSVTKTASSHVRCLFYKSGMFYYMRALFLYVSHSLIRAGGIILNMIGKFQNWASKSVCCDGEKMQSVDVRLQKASR